MIDVHSYLHPFLLQVRNHVEEVMRIVELDVLKDALVGAPGQNGLSVEARKRLSIAVEQVPRLAPRACLQAPSPQHASGLR